MRIQTPVRQCTHNAINIISLVSSNNLESMDHVRHGFLYYTRTDFMPFADSQKRAKIYSVFLYPVYNSIHL